MIPTRRVMAAALAAATLAAAPAQAADEWLASSMLDLSVAQGRAVCYITNLGPTSITLKRFGISDSLGAPQTLVLNDCGATLAPLRSCAFAANTGSDIPYRCATLTNNKANTRGTFELRGPNPPQAILNVVPLE